MSESELKERGEEIAPGNIFFFGWTGLSRSTDAVECIKCGGFASRAECTEEEIKSELNCGKPWACCCAAFVCKKCGVPDKDLAYIPQGSEHFSAYWDALKLAQSYAALNRRIMMRNALKAVEAHAKPFTTDAEAINCHHNYVSREHHFGENVFVTRKGAVSAKEGELGIIPGSMGARSFIVRGKGNLDSFCFCSHGAGRAMSRGAAKKRFTLADHEAATAGVECRKDIDVIDETPGAYKDIDAVMAAQSDLVEIVHVLKQVLCVKG